MCQQLEHELSLCHQNLILLLSSLSCLEGRCHSSPRFGSACLSSFSYKTVQCDFPYCSMSTCSFLLFFSSGSSSWNLVAPLETCSCISFAQVVFSFLFSFWIHLRISSNQSLVFGWFDGAHHHQFVLFLCERFHEIYKARHLPGSSCQLCGIEGQNKHWIVKAKLREYGQN